MNEENNKRVYLQIYDYETKEFSGLTTYHGLVRIYNSNTWPSRIFWSVVVLSCLSLFMIHSGYLLLGYHAKPTLFQVNTVVPDDGIQFPEITICNLNPIDIEKTIQYNISNRALLYALEFYNEMNHLSSKNTDEASEQEFHQFEQSYVIKYGEKFSMTGFMKSIGKSCEDTILSCTFGKEIIGNCCDKAVTELTDFGLCYRFANTDSKLKQYYSGEGYGWEFILNGNNQETDIPFPDKYSDRGFLLLIHERSKYPHVDSNSIAVSPNEKLHASLNIRNISLLERDNWGVCRQNWKKTQFISEMEYTAPHCENMCQIERCKSICGCVPLNLVTRMINISNDLLCTPSQMQKCSEKINDIHNSSCSCDSECDLLEFDISASYSNVSPRLHKKFGFTRNYIERHVSAASVFMRQVAYERHEQQKQLQTADLLSNIAGSMGLFLGMSTVTLLEIFIYLFKSVWGTVNSTRQRQFMEAIAEEERERQQSLVIIQDDDDENVASPAEQPGEETDKQTQRAPLGRKHSSTPIHIHLDRRNSRMLLGGDLFSAPRGSVSIPSQLLSPLSKHRKSISAGHIGRRRNSNQDTMALLTPGGGLGEVIPSRHDLPIRRSSTISPPTFHRKRDSISSQVEMIPMQGHGTHRKLSTQSVFRTQLL